MATESIAVGNLTTPALYVASFFASLYSDSGYTNLISTLSCPAVKNAAGHWTQGNLMIFQHLTPGTTYYMKAGPVSPGGLATPTSYVVGTGTVTDPACTFPGVYTASNSGIAYDIQPGNIPSDIDHFEAIWTKDGSVPDNSYLGSLWSGPVLANGFVHFFVGGKVGQTVQLFMRGVSTSGGRQNWVDVDTRVIPTITASGLTYSDGKTLDSLEPAQIGADMTSAQTIAYVGTSNNKIDNGNFIFGNLDGWSAFGAHNGAVYDSSNGGLLLPASYDGALSATFTVIPGQKYRFSFTGKLTGAGTQSIWFGIDYAASYTPNTSGTHVDFLTSGTPYTTTLSTSVYDWTAPAGANFASLNIIQYGTAPVVFTAVIAQDYGAANEWGADVTGTNTAANTVAVGARPAGDISGTVNPGGGIDFTHSGNTNQGSLSLLNTVDTSHIVAGAVNASIGFSNSALNVSSSGLTQIASIAISGDALLVSLRATIQMNPSSTVYIGFRLYKGTNTGTLLWEGLISPVSGSNWSLPFVIEGVDTSPGTNQGYTLYCNLASAVSTTLDVYFVADARKV
jgi:hypothetical protein